MFLPCCANEATYCQMNENNFRKVVWSNVCVYIYVYSIHSVECTVDDSIAVTPH